MSPKLKELVEITKTLPDDKATEVVDFARFLQEQAKSARTKSKRKKVNGDAEWERIINDPRPRPKLERYMKKILREGKFEPMDFSKL